MAEYHVENFGCRASRADGEAIGAELRQRGLARSTGAATADVIVVNTCTVTAHADRTARAFLRRIHRQNPEARILVTGCYAQRAPEEVAALPGVDCVVGNSHKSLVAGLAAGLPDFVPLASLRREPPPSQTSASDGSAVNIPAGVQVPGISPIYLDDLFAHASLEVAAPAAVVLNAAAAIDENGNTRGQTRPTLKVQDGCGNRCSFCVIPQTRGHSRSLPLNSCLRSVEAFAAAGGVELVLSGINLGRWGRDLTPPASLAELIGAIFARTSLERLRLSSIEPMDWTRELLSLFPAEASGRGLARHAHLPLQSGSDAILRAMHRRYRPWHYAEKLRAIREHMPDAAIGADVMVGFPGESDALFEESFAFIREQPLTYLHLFPFSARPGTPAWQLAQASPVPAQAVTERMQRLRQWITAKNLAFRQSFVGRKLPVVTLGTPASERSQGFTRSLADNFLEVRLDASLPPNQSVFAVIESVGDSAGGEGLTGRVID